MGKNKSIYELHESFVYHANGDNPFLDIKFGKYKDIYALNGVFTTVKTTTNPFHDAGDIIFTTNMDILFMVKLKGEIILAPSLEELVEYGAPITKKIQGYPVQFIADWEDYEDSVLAGAKQADEGKLVSSDLLLGAEDRTGDSFIFVNEPFASTASTDDDGDDWMKWNAAMEALGSHIHKNRCEVTTEELIGLGLVEAGEDND